MSKKTVYLKIEDRGDFVREILKCIKPAYSPNDKYLAISNTMRTHELDVTKFEAKVTVFTPDGQVLHLWLEPAQKLNLKKDDGVDVFVVKKAEVKDEKDKT